MEKANLERSVGLWSGTAIVAGSAIGSAVFLVASEISRNVPEPSLAIAVWVVAGLVSLCGGFSFSELGALFPGTGGPYVYLGEAFGPLPGFLYGWTLSLIIQPGSIAAVAIAFAQFASVLFPAPLSSFWIKGLASLAILGFTFINLRGMRRASAVMDWLTGLKIFALVAIAVAGFSLTARVPAVFSLSTQLSHFHPGPFGVALIVAFFGYDGWNNLSFVAGEVKNPERTLPLGLIFGITIAGALFVLVNASYFRFVTVPELTASTFPAADAARHMGLPGAVQFVIAAVLLSTLGCVNGNIMGGARVTYALAADRLFPTKLAEVHPTYHVPSQALIAQLLVCLGLVWSGTYAQLVTYVMCAEFIFFGLVSVALIVLRRRRPEVERPFKVPWYPILPLAHALFCVLFLINTLIYLPVESLLGAGMVFVGIPFYYLMRRRPVPPAV